MSVDRVNEGTFQDRTNTEQFIGQGLLAVRVIEEREFRAFDDRWQASGLKRIALLGARYIERLIGGLGGPASCDGLLATSRRSRQPV